jgi:hypothetical protein
LVKSKNGKDGTNNGNYSRNSRICITVEAVYSKAMQTIAKKSRLPFLDAVFAAMKLFHKN